MTSPRPAPPIRVRSATTLLSPIARTNNQDNSTSSPNHDKPRSISEPPPSLDTSLNSSLNISLDKSLDTLHRKDQLKAASDVVLRQVR